MSAKQTATFDSRIQPLRQNAEPGLIPALNQARSAALAGGAGSALVLFGDLPLIEPVDVRHLMRSGAPIVIAPDQHGTGTNALAMRPPDAIGFAFGPDSRRAHQRAAETAGCGYVEVEGPLSVDIDTPADLILVESLAPERIGAG